MTERSERRVRDSESEGVLKEQSWLRHDRLQRVRAMMSIANTRQVRERERES